MISLNFYKRKKIQYPILVNSIPKAGTNLLLNTILQLPGVSLKTDLSLAAECSDQNERFDFLRERISSFAPGDVYAGHIPFSEKISRWLNDRGFKQFFIYRDPRDVIVSICHYVMRDVSPRHAYFEMYKNIGKHSDRLLALIKGVGEGEHKYVVSNRSIPKIKYVYDAYESWLTSANVLPIKYENLNKHFETGNNEVENTIISMLDFLGLPNEIQLREKMINKGSDPNKSHTFRKGSSGDWHLEFSVEHIDNFTFHAQQVLEKWGYKS